MPFRVPRAFLGMQKISELLRQITQMQAGLLGVPEINDFDSVVFYRIEILHALECGGGLFFDLRRDVAEEDDDGIGIESGEAFVVDGGPAGILDDVLAAG